MQLTKLVVHQARMHGSEPAVGFGGAVIDFRGLMGATTAAIEALQAARVPSGGYVVLDVQNPAHHITLIYALALLGIRSASISTIHLTERAGPRPDLFLTDRNDVDPGGLPTRRIDARWFAFDPARPIDHGALLAMRGFPEPGDIVRYVYSSGTTGRPKCVALSNDLLERRIMSLSATTFSGGRSGHMLNMLGFSTILGTMMPFMTHIAGAMICVTNRPQEALQLTRLFQVSELFGSVAQVASVVEALGTDAPPASLKTVSPAGSRLSPQLLNAIQTRLCSGIRAGYGSTELGRVATTLGPAMLLHEGTAGYPMPWVTIEIVDEGGHVLPTGTDGILRIKSAELAPYADNEGRIVPSSAPDGWFYPGDSARLEADGLLVVSGRVGDVINRGGVVVAPEEIEDALRLDPRITDAAVVAVANAAGIDEIWAAIATSAPVELAALRTLLRERLNEKSPDRIFAVEGIPRTDSGKIMRYRVRELLIGLAERG